MHFHRLSDSAGLAPEAIVGPTSVGELRVDSLVGDIESVGSSKTGPRKLEPQGTRGKSEHKLPLKYLAGLVDSDGSITYQMKEISPVKNPGKTRVSVYVTVSQSGNREFLELVARSLTPPSCSEIWGHIKHDHRHEREAYTWSVGGSRGMSVCMLLKKYLVLKRGLAELAVRVHGKDMLRDEIEPLWREAKAWMPSINYPTSKWIAGYLDGNAHFGARMIPRGSCQPVVEVAGETRRRLGLDLLKKQYGGSLREWVGPTGTPLIGWTLTFDPAKFRSMFESDKGRIARSMVIKRDQVYFLLGCARMGHFRDGAAIRKGLEQLRTQPHRLNGPGAEVQELLRDVRDLPPRSTAHPGNQNWRMRQSELRKRNLTDYEGCGNNLD
jgi:hypothetical protein